MVYIAVLGYGTVGSGVVEVLEKNAAIVKKQAGEEIQVKYVLDLRDFPNDAIQKKIVHDYQIILDDEDIKVVVEVMGGVEPAYTFAKKALLAGKSVVTSNKALVAKHGAELLAVAEKTKTNFMFEASVGGGIPIIRPLRDCLTADEILEITGILNGTTNYMLTKMDREGAAYDAVLAEAQAKGYAERNPEADVEGYDTCRKIAILTSLVYEKQVDFEDIYTEGITGITEADFKYAKALHKGIKLLGTSRKTEQGVFAMVAPFMVDENHALGGVSDVFNGILVKGNALGDVMFYGQGAGKLATASAVVSDIVAEVKSMGKHIKTPWASEKLELAPMSSFVGRFLVRVKKTTPVLQVEELFGKVQLVEVDGLDDEYGFLTEAMTIGDLEMCCAKMSGYLSRLFVDG